METYESVLQHLLEMKLENDGRLYLSIDTYSELVNVTPDDFALSLENFRRQKLIDINWRGNPSAETACYVSILGAGQTYFPDKEYKNRKLYEAINQNKIAFAALIIAFISLVWQIINELT